MFFSLFNKSSHQRFGVFEADAAEDDVLGESDLGSLGQSLRRIELGVEEGDELVVALGVAAHVSKLGGSGTRNDGEGARRRLSSAGSRSRGPAAGALSELRPHGGTLHGRGERGSHDEVVSLSLLVCTPGMAKSLCQRTLLSSCFSQSGGKKSPHRISHSPPPLPATFVCWHHFIPARPLIGRRFFLWRHIRIRHANEILIHMLHASFFYGMLYISNNISCHES